MTAHESADVIFFKTWLTDNGGGFSLQTRLTEVPWGLCVTARESMPKDMKIVTCPFTLAITEEVAQKALLELVEVTPTNRWSERQWISSYICMHWIVEKSSTLGHHAYLKTLPPPLKLRTPLHFTPLELELFKGTNLYGATLDRENQWRAEWSQCRAVIERTNQQWGERYSWDLYLTAATYLSSRAFPSTLLSRNPTLQSSPSTQPVLLPGIDSLNHGRGQPVSWVVSYPDESTTETSPNISLILHTPAIQGQELLNNYGAKPNSELILGYGFSLPNNPDDTIVLKIGGMDGEKWEVGRSAKGANGLWDEIVRSIVQDPELVPTYEDHLDAAGALIDMIQALLDRLPNSIIQHGEIRPEVASMWGDYVEGQRDILESVITFAREKERLAVANARAEGVYIVFEDE